MPDEQADDLEAERVLAGLSRGRFGRISPERIARHITAGQEGGDWPIRRAALDALARRYGFGRRDEVRPNKGPARGLGRYVMRSGGGARSAASRSYDTAIFSLEPLRASCSCADFVRSSLGLCKHALVLLEALEPRAAALQRAGGVPALPDLTWESTHPLRGPVDRLERLRVRAAGGPVLPGLRGDRPLARTLQAPAERLALIVALTTAIAKGKLTAEPAVSTLLDEERRATERLQAARVAAGPALKHVSRLPRKLYPYQREGVKRFLEAGRLLLADDMGLGKTTQAIASCHALFEAGEVRRGLLIVPAALKPQWKREWDEITRVPLTLVEGSAAERARCYARTRSGYLIIGYEQLLRDLEHVQRFAPELIVLDEAQRIKNWATKSAAYVKSLAPRYRLVLTGTPMENRFDELASIMDFVDDRALEPKWRITPFHSLRAGDGGKGMTGVKELEVLRERLSGVMLRRVRQEVLTQLPARTDTRVPVEMTDAQRGPHDDLRKPIAELMSKGARRPLTQGEFLQLMQLLTRQRMLCNGLAQVSFEAEWPRCEGATATPELLQSLFAPKLAVLRGLIEQIVVQQGRKAVVFSQWTNMLKLSAWAIRDLLAGAGMRAVFFTGAESPKQRERAIVEFHDDPGTSVMFLSDAGGVGLNLQRAASCCINLELPWNPAVLEQRIGRIYRLGQTLPIDVFNLVTEEGIEARIAGVIANKKAVFSSLFDGTSNEVNFETDTSFMEGIKKLVEPVVIPVFSAADTSGEDSADLLDEITPAPPPAAPPVEQGEPVSAPLALLSRLRVERTAEGGLRIDAPAELAGPLAELLEGLARALRSP